MKDDIKSLIELDMYYQKKAQDAHDKKVNLEEELKGVKEQLKEEYWGNIKAEVGLEKAKLNKQVSLAVEKNKNNFEMVSQKLTKQYEENKDQWLEELFERTTSI
jgi:hypothetical protein